MMDRQVSGECRASAAPCRSVELADGGNGGNFIAEYERAVKQNDFVKWYNSNRGYVSCELTPDTWTTFFRCTPFANKPGSPIETKGTFVIQQGRPGAVPA